MDADSSGKANRPSRVFLFAGSALALLVASIGVAVIVMAGLALLFLFLVFSGGF